MRRPDDVPLGTAYSDCVFAILLAGILLAGNAMARGDGPKDVAIKFGKTIELTVNDDNPTVGDYLVDFDSGKTSSFPPDKLVEWKNLSKGEQRKAAFRWLEAQGIDGLGEGTAGILGVDLIAIPTARLNWEPQRGVFEQLEVGKPGTPIPITGHGELPATYLFKTREGGRGVLQILSFDPRTKGTVIRYRLEADG